MVRDVLLMALLAGACCASADVGNASFAVSCVYSSSAVYRAGDGRFDVEDIDPRRCTHAVYAFAGMSEVSHRITSLDPYNDLDDNSGRGGYRRFNELKQQNPDLKTLLGVGGQWQEGYAKYTKMAADPSARQEFVQSAVQFLHKYNFDGIELDWEFPAEVGGIVIDKDDYLALMMELKAAFEPEGLLLSASMGAGRALSGNSYLVGDMAKHLDLMNVMAFEYHGPADPYTGHLAPTYASPLDMEQMKKLYNVNATVSFYLEFGVPAEKMLLGVPLYGHGFLLSDPAQHGLYAPVTGPQPACPFTQTPGLCGFNEICAMLKKEGWSSVRDEDQQAIYSYNDKVWVGYEDPESVKVKAELIKYLGLGGAAMFSIDSDDFRDACGLGMNSPLLTAMWVNLQN